MKRPAPPVPGPADWAGFALTGIPAEAGMYCINHWIPAFAGMTKVLFSEV